MFEHFSRILIAFRIELSTILGTEESGGRIDGSSSHL